MARGLEVLVGQLLQAGRQGGAHPLLTALALTQVTRKWGASCTQLACVSWTARTYRKHSSHHVSQGMRVAPLSEDIRGERPRVWWPTREHRSNRHGAHRGRRTQAGKSPHLPLPAPVALPSTQAQMSLAAQHTAGPMCYSEAIHEDNADPGRQVQCRGHHNAGRSGVRACGCSAGWQGACAVACLAMRPAALLTWLVQLLT